MSKRLSISKQIIIKSIDLIKAIKSSESLSSIRANIDSSHYHQLIDELEKFPRSSTKLLGNSVRELKDLTSPILTPIIFDAEISWARNILFRNTDVINDFIQFSSSFSRYLLSSDFKKANETLAIIEQKYGYSIWLIKNKIALLQVSEGLESQKRYSQFIKQNLEVGSVTRFIVHWISVSNEAQTTIPKLSAQIDSISEKLNPISQIGLRQYLKYHILNEDIVEEDDFIHILRLSYSSSIFDYYEAFVSLLQLLAIKDENRNKLKNIFSLLKQPIFDVRLDIVKNIADNNISKTYASTALLQAHNLLISGNYNDAFAISLDVIKKTPDDITAITIAAYSNAFSSEKFSLSEEQLSTKLISYLSVIIENGIVKSAKELNEIDKLIINLSLFPWSSGIKLIIAKESTTFLESDKVTTINALKVSKPHPIFYDFLMESNFKDFYKHQLFSNYRDEICIKFALSADVDDLNGCNIFHVNLKSSFVNFQNCNYEVAIECAEKLLDSQCNYFLRQAYGLISRSQIELGKFDIACKTITNCYLKEEGFYIYLPIKRMFELIGPTSIYWFEISKLIEWSILLDACAKYVTAAAETNRRFAYEDYLLNNGLARPSELCTFDNIRDEEKDKLIYYIRYICTEGNMETSGEFANGSHAVLLERLALCKFLSEFDLLHKEDYKLEIKELVRRKVITDRRQEIDQSRIYVDTESIKKWANKEIKEHYNRYIEYLKFNVGSGDGKIEKSQESLMDVPDDEVNSLLQFIIEEITAAFTGSDYGLDRFLSTRIRHGILETHLRKPLQIHKLITKKESKTGPYLPNIYWLNMVNETCGISKKDLSKILSKFSEAHDNLIAKVTYEWLQVKKTQKPLGLFDFDISRSNVVDFSKSIDSTTTVQEFIEQVMKLLDTLLVYNLINVREQLNSYAKKSEKNLINDLQDKISKTNGNLRIELDSAINRARTDMQLEFDKVIEWFVPSTSGSSTPYKIEDAMIVAEAIVNDDNTILKTEITSKLEDDLLIHGQLPIFVDIFVNIFENVVKRSGQIDPVAYIEIGSKKPNAELTVVDIRVRNDLVNVDIDSLKKDLIRKKKLLDDNEYSEYLASEGNSGLFKIYKSVKDFHTRSGKQKANLDFGINKNNQFQIEMSVPFDIISKD